MMHKVVNEPNSVNAIETLFSDPFEAVESRKAPFSDILEKMILFLLFMLETLPQT